MSGPRVPKNISDQGGRQVNVVIGTTVFDKLNALSNLWGLTKKDTIIKMIEICTAQQDKS